MFNKHKAYTSSPTLGYTWWPCCFSVPATRALWYGPRCFAVAARTVHLEKPPKQGEH